MENVPEWLTVNFYLIEIIDTCWGVEGLTHRNER